MEIILADKYKGGIKGDPTATKLYAVVAINEDHEDTTHELFQANDEDHLEELVREDFVGETVPEDDNDPLNEIATKFEEEWGFEILWFEIGTVK